MTAPSVAYGQLAPMLIVFGVAVVGVLVEAFLPLQAAGQNVARSADINGPRVVLIAQHLGRKLARLRQAVLLIRKD
mgnify:CR=1 FL=1